MAGLAPSRRRLPTWPPRGGLWPALGAVLLGVALFVVAYALAAALAPSRAGLSSLATSAAPAPQATIAPPLDLAVLHATAEAGLNRAPGQRQAALTPATRPAPQSAAPATPPGPRPPTGGAPTPAGAAATLPAATATRTPTATPTRAPQFPSVTPRVTPTPTLTTTSTPTETPAPTETPTPTPTLTPLPAPCQATIPVPRLALGNGYYATVRHEVVGAMSVRWNVSGGTILVYRGKPSDLGPDRVGVAAVVPADEPLLRAGSGPITRDLGRPEPDQYTFYFFNGSPLGVGPIDAQVSYWTYGHCP